MFEKIKGLSKRGKFLQELTQGLGRIEILPERIVCYVDGRLIEEYDDKYKLTVHGIDEEDCIKYRGLSSNVIYVVDGVHFDKQVFCNNADATIVFKNCTFDSNIIFLQGHKFIFENNKYSDKSHILGFLFDSEDVTFINDNCISSSLHIKSKKVSICNSNIGTGSKDTVMDITASKLIIENSSIKAANVWIDTDVIKGSDSKLEGRNSIDIKSKEFNSSVFTSIVTPIISYNGVIIEGTNKCLLDEVIDMEEKKPLRIQLVSLLSAVKANCEDIRNKEVQEVVDGHNRKTIGKVLSRKLEDNNGFKK